MLKHRITLICSLLLGFIMLPAVASNMSFLNETPAKYYTDRDWEILSQTQDKALNHAKDNTKISWQNPQTQHNGYFIPYDTTRKQGHLCRHLKTYMNASGIDTLVQFQYCRIGNEWKILH